jgi:4-diphosphocytidyl-2-C-methyl-D-erythritol kinase
MKQLTLNAPAKINLGLNIVAKRNDGYHNLETFFYPIKSLSDKLSFIEAESFSFQCNNDLLNNEGNNLIVKAHSLLEQFTGKKLNVQIYLEKNIPIGAGLGGGSSDAANTLTGLNIFFHLNLNDTQLINLALQLGSDVPFFIKSQAAIGKSRGEILEYSNFVINKPILIVNPGIHISTKEVFENILPKENNFNYNYFLDTAIINFNYLKENLKNDFEDYVFSKYPNIKDIKNTMYKSKAIFSLMSGTGSTVYGVFNNEEEANYCKKLLPENYFKKVV